MLRVRPLPVTSAVIFLSFWAEVHYNSIYPEGGNKFIMQPHIVSFQYFYLLSLLLMVNVSEATLTFVFI